MSSSSAAEVFNGGKCEKVKCVALVIVKVVRRIDLVPGDEMAAKENEGSSEDNEARDAGGGDRLVGIESSDIP